MFSLKIRKYILLIWFLMVAPMMVYTFRIGSYDFDNRNPIDWGRWQRCLRALIPGAHPYEGYSKKDLSGFENDLEYYHYDIKRYKKTYPSISLEEALKKYKGEEPSRYESFIEKTKLIEKIKRNPRQTFKGAVKEWKLFLEDFKPFEFIATAIVSVMFLAFIYNMRKLLVVLWILVVMPGMFIVFSDWQWLDPFKITAIFTIIYFAIVYLMSGKSRKQNHQEMKGSASGDLKVVKNSELIKKVVNGERYVIQQKGKPRAAVVSMEDLKKLEEIENEIEVRSRKSTMADTGENTSSRKPLDNREK